MLSLKYMKNLYKCRFYKYPIMTDKKDNKGEKSHKHKTKEEEEDCPFC